MKRIIVRVGMVMFGTAAYAGIALAIASAGWRRCLLIRRLAASIGAHTTRRSAALGAGRGCGRTVRPHWKRLQVVV